MATILVRESHYWEFCLCFIVSSRKALFLVGLNRREESIEACLLSIASYPWNWSTWTLLGSCIGDGEEVWINNHGDTSHFLL